MADSDDCLAVLEGSRSAGSVAEALRQPVVDVVVVALVPHERVLGQAKAGRRLERAHRDADVFVSLDVGVPEQRRPAHRAEPAMDLFRRLVPRDRVAAVNGQVLAANVDADEDMARLLPALRAVTGFGLALQRSGDLEGDGAAKARSS